MSGSTVAAEPGRSVLALPASVNPPSKGRVLRIAGGVYQVDTGADILDCTLRGRLKQGDEQVVTGDHVLLEPLPDGSCRIDGLMPRTSKISRRAVAGSREQTIVANVDQLAAVLAFDRPTPDLRLLDRFLVLAELNGLGAFIVLNKLDLAESAQQGEFDAYTAAGYEVLPTSAKRGEGVDALRKRLVERATVFAGPSGVGKSSLLNLLLPDGELLKVREVSRKLGRGRHTTVGSTFFRLPEGGYVVDTPGLQHLALWQIRPDELAGAFPEFRPAIGSCRFSDCRHLEEPDCAVRGLLASGEASDSRYASFASLLQEAREAYG